MDPLGELLAVDRRQALEFFVVRLQEVSGPAVDRDEWQAGRDVGVAGEAPRRRRGMRALHGGGDEVGRGRRDERERRDVLFRSRDRRDVADQPGEAPGLPTQHSEGVGIGLGQPVLERLEIAVEALEIAGNPFRFHDRFDAIDRGSMAVGRQMCALLAMQEL